MSCVYCDPKSRIRIFSIYDRRLFFQLTFVGSEESVPEPAAGAGPAPPAMLRVSISSSRAGSCARPAASPQRTPRNPPRGCGRRTPAGRNGR